MAKLDKPVPERVTSGKPSAEDVHLDTNLRPRQLGDFIGQDKVKENLSIAMQAAKLMASSVSARRTSSLSCNMRA